MFQITVSLSWSRCCLRWTPKRCRKPSARRVSKASVAPEKSGSASSSTQPRSLNTFFCADRTAVTRSSIGKPPRSRLHATRTFLKSLFRLFEKISPGSAIETGAGGSGPAMADKRKAQSSTVRAIGPITASESQAFGEGPGGALDDHVVLVRHVVAVDRRAPGGADAFRRHSILVGDRQAREGLAAIDRSCPLEGELGSEGDDGVPLRVDALNLRDERVADLGRRELARADQ